jgi:hypothetical protein
MVAAITPNPAYGRGSRARRREAQSQTTFRVGNRRADFYVQLFKYVGWDVFRRANAIPCSRPRSQARIRFRQ